MLWFKREKIATDIATTLAPFMQSVFSGIGTTDSSLFNDPFLCGFLSGSCFALSSMATGGKLSSADSGDIQIRVYKKLIGEQWKTACDYTLKYMKLGDNNCVRGTEASHRYWAVTYGLSDLNSDPLFRALRQQAKAVGEHNKDRKSVV